MEVLRNFIMICVRFLRVAWIGRLLGNVELGFGLISWSFGKVYYFK